MINQTTIIILTKQPYQEANLIITGVTPDFGKISLLVYGGQKISAKKFPSCDLFQEFDVTFDDKDGSAKLFIAKDFELATDFSSIVNSSKNFKFIGKISQFLFKNVAENIPMPFLYDALRNVFLQLIIDDSVDGKWSLLQSAVLIKLIFLYESGMLPENNTPTQDEIIENIISAAIEGTILPDLSSAYYSQLNGWLDSLLDFYKISK